MKCDQQINMSNPFKCDILLIIDGLQILRHSGTSFEFILHPADCVEIKAFCDASSKVGIGGFVDVPNAPYFQVKWEDVEVVTKRDIQWREMVAIVVLIQLQHIFI